MSQYINSANYESFYLDYLEGNLNEQDAAELFLFLEANPLLVVDDLELVTLPLDHELKLDNSFATSLKINSDTTEVNASTIEWFLIADLEKQLTAKQAHALNQFLRLNPNYLVDKEFYQQTRFSSDKNLEYPNKQALYKGKIVPLFYKIMAIAASLLILVTVLQWNSKNTSVYRLATTQKMTQKKQNTELVTLKKSLAVSGISKITAKKSVLQERLTYTNPPSHLHLQQISFKKVTPITHLTVTEDLMPVRVQTVVRSMTVPEEDVEQATYASLAMANPIRSITEKIGEVINQEVDFKTTKAAHKKAGGFYLKIGKLEISRKVYDQTALALK